MDDLAQPGPNDAYAPDDMHMRGIDDRIEDYVDNINTQFISVAIYLIALILLIASGKINIDSDFMGVCVTLRVLFELRGIALLMAAAVCTLQTTTANIDFSRVIVGLLILGIALSIAPYVWNEIVWTKVVRW